MKTKLINTLKIMAALVVGINLTACGGNPIKNAERVNTIKSGVQANDPITGRSDVFYGWRIYVPRTSVEEICAAFSGADDERCKTPEKYKVEKIVLIEKQTLLHGLMGYPVLVPANTDIRVDDIVKFHTDGKHAPYFDAVVGHTRSIFYSGPEEECYREGGLFGKNSAGSGGLVCPKTGYDYKNLSIWKGDECEIGGC